MLRTAKHSFFFILLSGAFVAAIPSFAASVIVGSANDGNCYPFNCNDSGSGTGQSIEYQQVFSASQFGSSPVTITSISFLDQFLPGFGFSNVPLLGGSYTFSFAITNAVVGSLSTSLASNITSGESTFLDDPTDAGAAAGFSTLTFTGTTPYVYDPSAGNLLLDIVVTNQDNVSSASYDLANGFDSDDSGSVTSRAFQIAGQDSVADSTGLVVQFNSGTSEVPEPSSGLLIGGGLLLLAGWKKRAKAVSMALAATVALAISNLAVAQVNHSYSTVIPLHPLGKQGIPGKVAKHETHGEKFAETTVVSSPGTNCSGGLITIPLWCATYTINSVQYPVQFVGSDPNTTNTTTNITVPVIPVIVVVPVKGGTQSFDPTKKLNTAPAGSALSALLATLTSPIFQGATYNLGGTVVGTNVQFGDAVQRATWWNLAGTTAANWHTVLKYQLEPAVTLTPPPSANPSVNGTMAYVDNAWLSGQLDALSFNYGGATTFPLFVMYQVTQNGPAGSCCILGYHSAVQSGISIQTYGAGGYYDPGAVDGSADITDLSHEIIEWLNDPFGNTLVPAWPEPFATAPYAPGTCQNNLETADPLEDRIPDVFSVTTSGRVYHPQNVTLAPWMLQLSPSPSVNGWYTFQGPVDSEFTAPAPACPTP